MKYYDEWNCETDWLFLWNLSENYNEAALIDCHFYKKVMQYFGLKSNNCAQQLLYMHHILCEITLKSNSTN